MGYQVLIGSAYEAVYRDERCGCDQAALRPRHTGGKWVVIYPRAVYQIEDPAEWGKIGPDSKLPTI
jgi:hypothetical protein